MTDRSGYPFRFACRRSGNCCAIPDGEVRVGPDDIAAIASHLGLDVAAFASLHVQPDGVRLKDGLGGRCVFLQDGREASCAIYEVRPQKCRDWPFWPELRDDPERLRRAQRMCPGIEPVAPGGPESPR
ncbi:MAG: YkgJ family cysteine cluster protein [Planctomycetes bacterium]|nr:YkgJ family cysteine cluster protein [Planctomycetota bacterium]